MNDCEHQIFKPCVFLIDARSLNIDDETLGKMSRYIVERGGRAMMALPTHTDSDSVEILPKPKKGTHCTHIVAGYGAMNWTSYSEYGLVMDSAATVNILWVFGCMQAHRLLPCNAEMYSRDRIGIRPVNACTDQSLLVEKYYDDSMGETTSVSCSGFKRVERTLLEAMVGSLGLAFHKSLHVSGKIRTDVLIVLDTSDISSAKLQAARNANIPVVSFKWLLNSFKEWKLLPLHDLMSQNGNATDLDALVVEEESKEDEENLIPDSEDSESARECSPTPPVENVSVSGGDLVSLVSSQEVRGTENKSAQPISQDLSSTPNSSSKQEQRISPMTNEGKTRKQGGNDTEDPVPRKRPRKSQGTKAPVDRGDETDTKISKIQKATQEKPRIHITLSGMHSREQNECLPLLRALCIPYTAGTHSWNQKFTHVITPSLRRNQKCLCALACGAWIIHPSFLKACLSEESLVPEVCPAAGFCFLQFPSCSSHGCARCYYVCTLYRNPMKSRLETRRHKLTLICPISGEEPLPPLAREHSRVWSAPCLESHHPAHLRERT